MRGDPLDSALYVGRVMHKRLRPFRHKFTYRVFSLVLDLDELPYLGLRRFSYNRFNLLSFHDRDHGPRDGSPLRPWVEDALRRGGLEPDGGPIRLLCFPRVLGYVFNPLSVYFCYSRARRLRAVLYEVKNTFGDQFSYLIPVPASWQPGEPLLQTCDKVFYVSPFIGMESRYRFRVEEPGGRLSLLIRQSVPEGELLIATHTGRRVALSDRALLQAFLSHPLMTFKVIGAIHWEALWLWVKGAVFHHRPSPPQEQLSLPAQEEEKRR